MCGGETGSLSLSLSLSRTVSLARSLSSTCALVLSLSLAHCLALTELTLRLSVDYLLSASRLRNAPLPPSSSSLWTLTHSEGRSYRDIPHLLSISGVFLSLSRVSLSVQEGREAHFIRHVVSFPDSGNKTSRGTNGFGPPPRLQIGEQRNIVHLCPCLSLSHYRPPLPLSVSLASLPVYVPVSLSLILSLVLFRT